MNIGFGKLSRKLYKTENVDFRKIDITNEVNSANINIMKISSILMFSVFGIMFILSFLLENYKSNCFFYGFEVVEMLMIFLATIFILPKKPAIVLPTIYFFVSLLYYYGIHIGVVSTRYNLAVTTVVFLAVLPQIFIDNPIRIIVFSTIAAFANVLFMIIFKDKSVLIVDLTDVVFCWVVGVGLGVAINRVKVNNFIRGREIAIERDTDGLTQLWNKNALVRKITEAIQIENSSGAFFIMDIDHFKQLNDTLGHSFGDEVLIKTSECVQNNFRKFDILGRFGGDEFIFYMPGADADLACECAHNLLDSLYNNIRLPNEDKGLRGSIGIALYGYKREADYDELMKKADKALYVTKENGRFGYTLYSDFSMEKKFINVD